MAKYIDADTVVSMPFLDDSYGIEKHTMETDTIENLLDRFTKEGCPESADVAPYSVSPDGTLIITVPKGTTANRVLVEWEGTHCGGLYYAD